jgi:hypothetical protein
MPTLFSRMKSDSCQTKGQQEPEPFSWPTLLVTVIFWMSAAAFSWSLILLPFGKPHWLAVTISGGVFVLSLAVIVGPSLFETCSDNYAEYVEKMNRGKEAR